MALPRRNPTVHTSSRAVKSAMIFSPSSSVNRSWTQLIMVAGTKSLSASKSVDEGSERASRCSRSGRSWKSSFPSVAVFTEILVAFVVATIEVVLGEYIWKSNYSARIAILSILNYRIVYRRFASFTSPTFRVSSTRVPQSVPPRCKGKWRDREMARWQLSSNVELKIRLWCYIDAIGVIFHCCWTVGAKIGSGVRDEVKTKEPQPALCVRVELPSRLI